MSDQIVAREGYVFVQSAGKYTLDRFKESLGNSLRLAEEEGLDKILVDARRQTELPSTLDTFEGAQELAAKAPGMRIAVVMSDDVPTQHRFFETASRNRGARMRTFPDEAQGLAWLFDERS